MNEILGASLVGAATMFIVYFLIINLAFRIKNVPQGRKKKFVIYVIFVGLFSSIILFITLLGVFSMILSPKNNIGAILLTLGIAFLFPVLGEFVDKVNGYTGDSIDNKVVIHNINQLKDDVLNEVEGLKSAVKEQNKVIKSLRESQIRNVESKNEVRLNVAGFEIKVRKK